MKSVRRSNTEAGSILLEVSIAVVLFSISLTALSSVIFSEQDTLLQFQNERKIFHDSVAYIEKITKSLRDFPYFHDPHIFAINACLNTIATGTISVLHTNILHADGLAGDCISNLGFATSSVHFKAHLVSASFATSQSTLDALDKKLFSVSQTESTTTLFTHAFLDSENQPASLELESEINALDAIRDKIFLAAAGNQNQFQIVHEKEDGSLEVKTKTSLPGVTGSFPSAISISYFNKKVYVGTHRTAGREFHIFDVSGTEPAWLGSHEVNHNVNALTIREPYAFLATSGNIRDLIVLDISNPQNITRVSTLTLDGNEDALSIFLSHNSLYLGRKKATQAGHPEFAVIDIHDPANPLVLATHTVAGDVVKIIVLGHFAFLGINSKDPHIEVLDISQAKNINSVYAIPFSEKIIDLDIQDAELFVQTETGLHTYELTFTP